MNTIRKIGCLFLVWIFSTYVYAQQTQIDSLTKELQKLSPSDTNRVYLLRDLYEFSKRADVELARSYVAQIDSLSKVLNFKEGIGIALNCQGNLLDMDGKYLEAKSLYIRGRDVYASIKNQAGIAKSVGNIGTSYLYLGKHKEAIEYLLKAVELYDKLKDEKGKANNLNNIGVAYFYLQNYDKAEEYWLYTVNSFEKQGNKLGMAYSLNNLGMIFSNKLKDHDMGLAYYEEAYQLLEELGDKKGMASALNNIAEGYYQLKQYKNVLEMYRRALVLKGEIGDIRGKSIIWDNIGRLYVELGNFPKAVENYNLAKNSAMSVGYLDELKDSYDNLSQVYEKMGKLDSALFYQRMYSQISDSIYQKESAKSIAEMETKYQSEEKKKENLLLRKENELKSSTIARQRLFEIAMAVGILMLLAIVGLVFYQFRVKKKANTILQEQKLIIEEKNEELNQFVEEIAAQRDQIDGQRLLLEQKNTDILSSIQYAKRIQEAILPNQEIIRELLPNAFVLYKPKDIVSGDFYWLEQVGDKVLFAAVDCTGHGVPGAFMSIIGHNGLTKAVNEQNLLEPGKILDFLDVYVRKTLHETKEGTLIKDGMDIALCCWDKNTNVLEYAGAYNSLYLVTALGNSSKFDRQNIEILETDSTQLIEFKASKQPIGFTTKDKNYFTNHKIILSPNDAVYISSDGFADQFGGPDKKKFMAKNMKKMFLEHSHKLIDEQLNVYNHIFEQWKGFEEQLDDVCVIGLKV